MSVLLVKALYLTLHETLCKILDLVLILGMKKPLEQKMILFWNVRIDTSHRNNSAQTHANVSHTLLIQQASKNIS